MLTKVEKVDIVPDDIKELLLPEKGEYVVIGSNVYDMKQFPVTKYFELLFFMSKYFSEYNELYATSEGVNMYEFFGLLSQKLKEKHLIDEFMNTLFPELPNAAEEITFDQLRYLLGVIYKLNFLSQDRPIQNLETRTSIHKMMQMLGLNLAKS
jgi:hypothetical protein